MAACCSPARLAAILAAIALLPRCGSTPPPPSGSGPVVTLAPANCTDGPPVTGSPALTLRLVASGLAQPVALAAPPGDLHRIFIVEKAGRIRLLQDGVLTPATAPYLDITDRVTSSRGEDGLLGLAFHPRFAENGRFFVQYQDLGHRSHIAEFHATSPTAADPASERTLLVVQQPGTGHNAGALAFDHGGKLLASLGDGSDFGDVEGNAQRLSTLLGKILRIDVDVGSPYGIPADNPFVATDGARPEIFAYGFRNPWRFSVDANTGDVLIGDVGAARQEEIDVVPAASHGGQNFGWNVVEGMLCFDPATGCDMQGKTAPLFVYGHDQGCAVSMGPTYHGCRLPGYAGATFYSDLCGRFLRSFRLQGTAATDARDFTAGLGPGLGPVTSMATDGEGELYFLDLDGHVYKVVPAGS